MSTNPPPTSFVDRKGRIWHLELTVDLARRIKSTKGIDLLDYGEGGGLARLYQNPMDLADVLWLLCEEQATAAKIDDVEFGRRLGGEAIDAATAAMCQAIVNFSPRHQRAAMSAMHARVNQFLDRAGEAAIETLNSEEMERELETILKKSTPGASSGG